MPASRTDSSPADHGRIEDIDVSTEMQGSFLEYAYSVIYSRALPDARDGLKPVQRRILYQMAEMGLRPDRGHVKSARVVGEVMGKLHPHGDAPIYDALVRLAQPFTLRVPLVDGHGNFGSLDDGPAAPRYTEARLAPPALALTENLDEDVVDFIPNYDDQFQQPEVLPAAFPNLLVNGATRHRGRHGDEHGAAQPHRGRRRRPRTCSRTPTRRSTTSWSSCPAPTCPPAASSSGSTASRTPTRPAAAASTPGRRCRSSRSARARTGLVVTELPYLVGPERVIEKIKDGVQSQEAQRHRRRHRPHRPQPRPAARHRHQDRLRPRRRCSSSSTGYTPLEDSLQHQQRRPRRRAAADARAARAAARLPRPPHRGRHPPQPASACAPQGAPAPRRGPAHRDPRHRRGHPGHPHLATTASRRARACMDVFDLSRAAGRVHPRAAAAPAHEVLADRARGRARQAASPRSPSSRSCSASRGAAAQPGRPRARRRGRDASAPRAARCSPRRAASRRRSRAAAAAPRPADRRRARAACSCRPPAAWSASTSPADAPSGGVVAAGAPQQARRDPLAPSTPRRAATIGAVTSAGGSSASRPSTCPRCPATRCSSPPARASTDYLGARRQGEHVVGLVPLDDATADRARHRAGHRQAGRAAASSAPSTTSRSSR